MEGKESRGQGSVAWRGGGGGLYLKWSSLGKAH